MEQDSKFYRLSGRSILIILLLVFVILLLVVPFEKIRGKPSILGAMVARVFVKPSAINTTCNVDLVGGWNLMSVACASDNSSLSNVLKSIDGMYVSIHGYNSSDVADPWKSYNPNMPEWVVQDLFIISEKSGYWINMNSSGMLSVNGTITTSPHKISLIRGWNLIGYPSENSKEPSDAFSSIAGSYSIAWAYNASEQEYLYYNPYLDTGTLTMIIPGLGYWINMTEDDDLWLT